MNEICFVKKGIIRAFYIKDGEEITGLIKEENNFFASFEGIILQQNSSQVFIALEDTELSTIDYQALKKLTDQYPQKNRNRMYTNNACQSTQRH